MTEREAVVAFLREESAQFTATANRVEVDSGIQMALRLDAKASVLRTVAAYIERGDHLVGRDVEVPTIGYQPAEERDE